MSAVGRIAEDWSPVARAAALEARRRKARDVVGLYTGSAGKGVGSAAVNRHLHGAPISPEERAYAESLLPRLDSVFAEHKLDAPTTVYRGVDHHYGTTSRPDHKPGDEIPLPGFVSTSSEKKVARQFAADAPSRRRGGVLHHITVPAGASAVPVESSDRKVGMYHNEREVILDRGGKLRVKKVSKPDKDNVVHVHSEFVPRGKK